MRGRRALSFLAASVFAICAAAPLTPAKPGKVDLDFGQQFGFGAVPASAFTNGIEDYGGLAAAPGGKLVLAADTDNGVDNDFALARLRSNGKLDQSFGDPVGHVATGDISENDDVTGVAVQGNGKIVVVAESQVAGVSEFGVAKLEKDGTPDGGFNGTGTVTTAVGADAQPFAVAIQPNGNIVVVGDGGSSGVQRAALVRYLPSGAPDSSFGGGDGIVTSNFGGTGSIAFGLAIQRNGKIVIAGLTEGASGGAVIARFRPNGTPDPGFGMGGNVKLPKSVGVAFRVAVQPNGRIIFAGLGGDISQPNVLVGRLMANGRLDRSFGLDRKGINSPNLDLAFTVPTGIALQRNGKIVVAGRATDIPVSGAASFVARFTRNGRIDHRFGADGSRLFLFDGGNISLEGGVVIQPDGRIVGAGAFAPSGDIDALLAKRFFGDPPQTRIGKAELGGPKARFSFSAVPAAGAKFSCALRRAGSGRPHFSNCSSPRKFSGLRRGSYTFEVRAHSVNGPDRTPAKRSFGVP